MMTAAVIATILLVVGGLNWLFIGIFNWNMISSIFGLTAFTRIFYVLIGLAAAYMVYYMIRQTIKRSSERRSHTRNKTQPVKHS